MKFRRLTLYIIGAILTLPLLTSIFGSQTALAYKCSGETSNQQHYYRDGACYQPVGSACLDNPPPSDIADCKNRDTSKDTRVADEKPVKNDGTEVAEWQCASGTYNTAKHTCETCNSFGNCQTNTKVMPTPKGDDTTKDPSDTSNNSSSEDDTAGGGSGECAGEKTDFFACDADGSDAIVGILRIIILIVSVGVGVVAVGGIVYGAILYAGAQDNQDQVRQSIKVIRNVIIGLLLYIFMVTILNFLVPGGVFGGAEPETPETTNGTNTQNTNTTNGNNQPNNSNNNTQN